MEKRILEFGESNICLFCGKEQEEHIGHDYETWYECDCADARLEREILEKIEELKSQLPREKYEVRQQDVLIKKRR